MDGGQAEPKKIQLLDPNHLTVGVLEYLRGAIYRGRYMASRAALLGVLEISRSAIYRGRYGPSRTPLVGCTVVMGLELEER